MMYRKKNWFNNDNKKDYFDKPVNQYVLLYKHIKNFGIKNYQTDNSYKKKTESNSEKLW